MTTAIELITDARWDIKDEEAVQYSDAMLLSFLNRGLRPLCSTLASLNNDWVNESTTLTLDAAAEYTTLPTDFISGICVRISSTDLVKKPVSWVRGERIGATAGQPGYFAIQGTSLMFEKAADVEYSIILEYHKSAAAVTINNDMPFNDEFNDIIRQFISLVCKSRIEYTSPDTDRGVGRDQYALLSEMNMQTFFYQALYAKTVARNYIPNLARTDF